MIFGGMPVRVAFPSKVSGLFNELKDPSFATVVGLLLYRARHHTEYEININQNLLHSKGISESFAEDHSLQLSDIRLNDVVEDTKNEIRQRKEQQYVAKKEKSEIGFSLDDLSSNPIEENNPLKKFTNWAKQLF
jgi:cell division protein FtsA